MNFYAHFNLAMDRSPGFGSALANCFALFRLAFASAPVLNTLTSLAVATRRSVLQKVQGRASNALPLLVNIGFQVLFHSPPGVLFTFPSRYSFAIGHQVVFSLGGWSPLLPAGFLVSCGTLVPARRFGFSSTGLLPPLAGLSFPIRLCSVRFLPARNPMSRNPWFGLFPVRSPLLRESIFLSFPPGT